MNTSELGGAGQNDAAWQHVRQEFTTATDEITCLRMQAIADVLAEQNISLSQILVQQEEYRTTNEENDEVPPELELYDQLHNQLIQDESDLSVRLLRSKYENAGMYVPLTGVFVSWGPVGEDGEEMVRGHIVRAGQETIEALVVDVAQTSDEEQISQLADMVQESVESGLLTWEPVTLQEAEAFIRSVKVIRRYVGQSMYNRTPLPTDPV